MAVSGYWRFLSLQAHSGHIPHIPYTTFRLFANPYFHVVHATINFSLDSSLIGVVKYSKNGYFSLHIT
jgi:hypothetical protein